MKKPAPLGRLVLTWFWALVLMTFVSIRTQGQFYAPETDFHDSVQRVFIVEAARVLAWRANLTKDQIASVFYEVQGQPTGGMQWKITWRDAQDQPVKTAQVQYAETTLKQGAQFYREAFGKLWVVGWPELVPLNPGDAVQEFWAGAAQAGLSREESLVKGWALANMAGAKTKGLEAQLAGLLAHSALPGVAGRLSLDSVLAARSAAWLALTERACSNQLSRLWAPVLQLAGREAAARQAWRLDSGRLETGKAGSLPEISAWDRWMGQATSQDIFLFAVDSPNWALNMALLSYDVQTSDSGEVLAEVLGPLVGSAQRLVQLHNYAPFLARWTGVGGGHIMNGAWPLVQRQAWLLALEKSLTAKDRAADPALVEELEEISAALSGLKAPNPDNEAEAGLLGLPEVGPLLRRAHKDNGAKLVPTAVASVQDVLNYGSESLGAQMGARYRFVNATWGVPERATPLREATTREVVGLIPFFWRAQEVQGYPYAQAQRRLQLVDGLRQLVGWSPHPYAQGPDSKGSAWLFARRCWMRSTEFEWQARALWDEGQLDQISRLIRSFQEEGGPLAAAAVLRYLTSLGSEPRALIPDAENAMVALAARLPQPTPLYLRAIWSKEIAPKNSMLAYAQTIEPMYWRNPGSALDKTVMWNYASAGAHQAARRFYLQAREHFNDPVRVSNGVGPIAYILGLHLRDEELRRKALADSQCGSGMDMFMQIWEAAFRGDNTKLRAQVEEWSERYDPANNAEAPGQRLLKFLSLLPALRDRQHPERQRALDFFGRDLRWTVLRWIWIEQFNLPKDDAIALLGGKPGKGLPRVLIAYLDHDTNAIQTAAAKIESETSNEEQQVLAFLLAGKLTQTPPIVGLPDLKPAGAVSTRSAVVNRLARRNRGNVPPR